MAHIPQFCYHMQYENMIDKNTHVCIYTGDNSYQKMSTPIYWKKKKKRSFSMFSAAISVKKVKGI